MRTSLVFAVACAFMTGLMAARGHVLAALFVGAGAAINFGNLYIYLGGDRQKSRLVTKVSLNS